ncbi:MAG: bifunctional phosphopantothenoylcysteine decarboxylase/phosphopantothenate--cysteine ligase CoaBC, partial [Candidatus Eiseniibacteriota bacterium]
MLAGKTVVLGVSGGIAAYKSAEIVRWLKKERAAVIVVMTPAAKQFITPLTLATLSGNPVLDDLWAPNQMLTFGRPRERTSPVEHIEIADAADLVIVAPATADLLARVAHGLGDDMVTTTILATRAPVLFAPAMNVQMWENPIVQENLAGLRELGYHFAEPETGELACGWEGRGRLASLESIAASVAKIMGARTRKSSAARNGLLRGRHVVVTAGPTREALDPVRYLSNHSSGRMGYALAEVARNAGATVTLITGPTALPRPAGVEIVPIESARDLARAVGEATARADALVMAAAVADFRPARPTRQKIKRGTSSLALELVPNPDILKELPRRPGLRVVGFALETENELAAAKAKLVAKNCDLLVLNNPTRAGSEFGGDTNEVAILDRAGHVEKLPILSKREVAERVVARLAALLASPARRTLGRTARRTASSTAGRTPRKVRR